VEDIIMVSSSGGQCFCIDIIFPFSTNIMPWKMIYHNLVVLDSNSK